jgi:hypothetical protein
MVKSPETSAEYIEPRLPSNGDIIKVDGRWAEVFSSSEREISATYLPGQTDGKNSSEKIINIHPSYLVLKGQVIDTSFGTLLAMGDTTITELTDLEDIEDRKFFAEYEIRKPN